jgi:N-acetylated-alpha-linked acidic dipeptidase
MYKVSLIGTTSRKSSYPQELTSTIRSQFMNEISTEQCERNLYNLTRKPSLAGTPGGKAIADFIQSEFKRYGLEDVHQEEYNVYLPFPTNNNKLQLIKDENDEVQFEADLYETPIAEDTTSGIDKTLVPPYNGYSASGLIEKAKIVYVNYGTYDEFDYLTEKLGMDLTGKVILVRYGRVFRGVKTMLAERHKAAAIIIYSDPADDATPLGKIYPDGPGRPDSAIQRG